MSKVNKINKSNIKSNTISISNNTNSEKQEKQIETLANLLYQKAKRDKEDKVYASAKTILSLLGMGITIASVFAAPKAVPSLLNTFWKEENEWRK